MTPPASLPLPSPLPSPRVRDSSQQTAIAPGTPREVRRRASVTDERWPLRRR